VLDYEPGLQLRLKAILCYRYTLLSTEFTDLPSCEQFFEDVAELFHEGLLFGRAEVLQSQGTLRNELELMPNNYPAYTNEEAQM